MDRPQGLRRRFPVAALLWIAVLAACPGPKHVPASLPVITSFTASPPTVGWGEASWLTATFANGSGSIDQGLGAVTSGATVSTGTLQASTTFTLTVTNSAGDAVSRRVTVAVGSPGLVTIVQRETNGNLEPVAGIDVHRSDAASGAFLETRATDAAGAADFGSAGAQRRTLSLVRPGNPARVISFVDVPPGPITLRLDRLPGELEVLSTVQGAVTPASFDSQILLPSGGAVVGTAGAQLAIARQDLQSDGRVSMLASSGGTEGSPMSCGSTLDQPLPAAGASVSIAVAGSPSWLDYTASDPVLAILAARRKDVLVTAGDGGRAGATGSIETCLGSIPDFDLFAASAQTPESSAQATDGYDVIVTTSSRRVGRVLPGPTMPSNIAFPAAGVGISTITDGPGAIQVGLTGAAAADVDLAVVHLSWGATVWHLFAAGDRAGSLSLPSVPGVAAPAWGSGVSVSAEVSAIDGVSGFDALWNEARRLGSIDQAILSHGGSITALGSIRRFTPSHVIAFDGFTWERYGTIASADGQILCGSRCTGDYLAGTTIHLTATANSGARFAGWGGNCTGFGLQTSVDVLVDQDLTCSPSFGPATNGLYQLSVNVAGAFPALIVSDDQQIKCGQDAQGNLFNQCTASFLSGYRVGLGASPATSTVVFDMSWGGGCSGASSSTDVVMDANKSCSVTLTPVP